MERQNACAGIDQFMHEDEVRLIFRATDQATSCDVFDGLKARRFKECLSLEIPRATWVGGPWVREEDDWGAVQ